MFEETTWQHSSLGLRETTQTGRIFTFGLSLGLGGWILLNLKLLLVSIDMRPVYDDCPPVHN
jgi:hypothetical protein